ncbi:unnamed protein product [Eruca vesicaria subsp. sativa]|uniref:Uncharacterized protein n=1 Tax=Eruca vesicaria subsp. sativa TaxID=29727 RepID=A0ABC8J736_ERUVS|nr:unnamed protein product [Eruca vesicaria subsp. sativa]
MSYSMALFGDLPNILSIKDTVKEFLCNFSYCRKDFVTLLEELKGMTPTLRYASINYDRYERVLPRTPFILGNIRSSCDFGEVLVELVLSPKILVKKLEVFEIREARLTVQKIKAVKSLSEIMLLLNGDGAILEKISLKRKEISEKISECMKSICEGEIGLQDVLEEASWADLVALLSK